MSIRTETLASSRRDFLRAGMYRVGISAALPADFRQLSLAETTKILDGADEKHPNRILVVVELSSGNDGLNTVVPYTNDAYYRARPRLAIKKNAVLRQDEQFGLHLSCEGLHRLFKEG